jgi:hypothetical protein
MGESRETWASEQHRSNSAAAVGPQARARATTPSAFGLAITNPRITRPFGHIDTSLGLGSTHGAESVALLTAMQKVIGAKALRSGLGHGGKRVRKSERSTALYRSGPVWRAIPVGVSASARQALRNGFL